MGFELPSDWDDHTLRSFFGADIRQPPIVKLTARNYCHHVEYNGGPMTDQRKEGIGMAARQSWKEGFDTALSTWRTAKPEDKRQAASNFLAFVGSTGLKLKNFVDDAGIGIDEATAEQIRADFKNR